MERQGVEPYKRVMHRPRGVTFTAWTEEDRRQEMKAYWKQMRSQPGFGSCDFDFSDSDDDGRAKDSAECAVPSISDLLGDLDEQERQELRSKPEHRIAEAAVPSFDSLLEQLDQQDAAAQADGQDEPDAVKEFLGIVVDTDEALSAQNSLYRPKRKGFADYQQMLTNSESARRSGIAVSQEPPQVEASETSAKPAPIASLPKGWVPCAAGKVVSLITLSAHGAVNQACNSVFKYESNHRGRPLYKATTGAIIYFNGFWKMNSSFKVTSWLYSVSSATGQKPPEGQWAAEGSANRAGVTVRVQGQRMSVLGEKGPQFFLEDGTIIAKSLENKSWCWVATGEKEENEMDAIERNKKEIEVQNHASPSKADDENNVVEAKPAQRAQAERSPQSRMSFSEREKYYRELRELKRQLEEYEKSTEAEEA